MTTKRSTQPEPAEKGAAPASAETANGARANGGLDSLNALGFLRDVPLEISVEIGRKRMAIGDVLALGPSAIIELDKAAGESLDIRVNGVLVARGEAVVVNDRFGVRLTSLIDSANFLSTLQTGR